MTWRSGSTSPTMPVDPQLDLFEAGAGDQKNVAWLETLLRERKIWMTAAQILQLVAREESDSQKRYLRHIAQASEWIISGQKGYKHLEHATAEEINHFANWMESQATEMTRRAEAVRRNAHRICG
jgi:hypothetical protein